MLVHVTVFPGHDLIQRSVHIFSYVLLLSDPPPFSHRPMVRVSVQSAKRKIQRRAGTLL